jgi:hypothetical protein
MIETALAEIRTSLTLEKSSETDWCKGENRY